MKQWFRRDRQPDIRPLVEVIEVPNRTVHEYRIAKELGTITCTPHEELFGRDFSKIYRYPPMDERTQQLYDTIRGLDERIESISVTPHSVRVGNEWRSTTFNRVTADWLPHFDATVVDCLAQHMNWPDGARFTVRRQTEEELWQGMDLIISQEIARGTKPPKGWPYTAS